MPKFFHRLFISVLSVVIFSALAAAYQLVFSGGDQLGFGLLTGIYTFYTAPVFILGGIPASYAADHFIKKHKYTITSSVHEYVRAFSLYAAAGVTVSIVYFSLSALSRGQFYFTPGESLTSILIGVAGALVYYHISLLLKINWEKLKEQQHKKEQEDQSYSS